MPTSTTPPQAAPEIDAAANDQDHIDRELDAFEAIVRAALDASLRTATSTLNTHRWH